MFFAVCVSVCRVFAVLSLTQVVLPALQGRFLQSGPGRADVHVSSVVAGQRHFEDVLQHLPLAVHQLRPDAVHGLQQQLSSCTGGTIFISNVTKP